MTQPLLVLSALATLVFLAAGMLLHRRLGRDERLRLRVIGVQRSVGIDTVAAPIGGTGVLGLIGRLGEVIARSGLLSARTLEELEQTLRIAGFRGRNVLGLFVGTKLLLLIALPAMAWLVERKLAWQSPMASPLLGAAGIVGLLLPDYAVRRLHQRHLAAVERGLPDALDMMVICTEAGLGLEPAIERVALEIAPAHPAVAEELTNTAHEMRVNADRRAALVNMGLRTGLQSLRRLGATLIQTMQYGTPLSQALRVLAAEMRQEAMTRFEARAARLPVLLTVPMIVFILPCVFLIVGGPAVVAVIQALRQ